MVQRFLEVSLSSASKLPRVFLGCGRRRPRKKPSGSESEEEEQVGQGQGASSLGSGGFSRRSCSRPLWVSRLELEVAAGNSAREVNTAFNETQSLPSVGSGPASPVPDRVRARTASVQARRDDPLKLAGVGRSLLPRPRPCAQPPPRVLPRGPRLSLLCPPASGRVPRPGASPAPQPRPRRRVGSGGPWSAPARDAR